MGGFVFRWDASSSSYQCGYLKPDGTFVPVAGVASFGEAISMTARLNGASTTGPPHVPAQNLTGGV